MNKIFVSLSAVAILLLSCTTKPTFDLDEHIGVCGGPGRAAVAATNGLAYVEASVSGFLIPESSEEEFEQNRKIASECPLPIYSANGFFPREIKVVGPEADLERAIKYSEKALSRASELGIKVLVLGSGRSRTIPDGFDRAEAEKQFVELLKGIAPYAEKYQIPVAIEPLRRDETNFINTVSDGAELARKAESDYIGVIADFYHMLQNGEDESSILDNKDKLRHCHVAECEERTAPGVKGDDFTPFFKALKEIGYQGGISFECGWDNIEEQMPIAVKTLKDQIAAVK